MCVNLCKKAIMVWVVQAASLAKIRGQVLLPEKCTPTILCVGCLPGAPRSAPDAAGRRRQGRQVTAQLRCTSPSPKVRVCRKRLTPKSGNLRHRNEGRRQLTSPCPIGRLRWRRPGSPVEPDFAVRSGNGEEPFEKAGVVQSTVLESLH